MAHREVEMYLLSFAVGRSRKLYYSVSLDFRFHTMIMILIILRLEGTNQLTSAAAYVFGILYGQ